MGYAKIVSGGPDGRYTVELDYGKARLDAIIAGFTQQRISIQNRLNSATVEQTDADAREAELEAALAQEWLDYSAQDPATRTTAKITKAIEALGKERSANAPLRLRVTALRHALREITLALEQYQTVSTVQTREAWCVDLTENRAAGSFVATAEIPGEPSITVILAGARAPIASDGYVRAREVQSPWQAYYNAAILPGWQKWMPTYRWGTISAIDYDNNKADVALSAATSSAASLGVNQSSTLAGIPVVYMTCNADAFTVGDRVVVAFTGQSWSDARVIGFLDNPRMCIPWPSVTLNVSPVRTILDISSPGRWLTYAAKDRERDPGCDSRYNTAIQYGTSAGTGSSSPLWEVSLQYPTTPNLGPDGRFTIEQYTRPSNFVIGTENLEAQLIFQRSLSQAERPYPIGEVRGFLVTDSFIEKYTSPQETIVLYDYSNNPPLSVCVPFAEAPYTRYARIPIGFPWSAEEADDLLYNPARFLALLDVVKVHDGPPRELLGEPVLRVGFNGPNGRVVAQYVRTEGDIFKKRPGPVT